MADRSLGTELLRLRNRDLDARERLAATRDLFDGYTPEMEAVHVENAEVLARMIARHGWPRTADVGAEAADAAWLVAQHAISRPDRQRAFHAALAEAVERGDAAARHFAQLTDRIRFNERRPQVYGTIHDWDEAGEMSPWPIERPEQVEDLRRSVGLPPLCETTRRLRAEARAAGERPPASWEERRARQRQWARRVGWLGDDVPCRHIDLRPAGPADVALLRRWAAAPHVMAATGGADWQWETELQRSPAWRELLIAERAGRPVGFIQIMDPALEETHYWGDVPAGLRALDVWIGEADDLGRGYGTVMMRLALERCFAEPAVSAILVDPLATNVRAQRFYARLGFRLAERRRFGDDECAVHRLERMTWQRRR